MNGMKIGNRLKSFIFLENTFFSHMVSLVFKPAGVNSRMIWGLGSLAWIPILDMAGR